MNKGEVREKYKVFSARVEKSKLLGAELRAMDTRGFSNEVKIIRVKLKNLNSLSGAEKELKSLRRKIDAKRKGVVKNEHLKAHDELVRNLERRKAKISELKGKLERARGNNENLEELRKKYEREVRNARGRKQALKQVKETYEEKLSFLLEKRDRNLNRVRRRRRDILTENFEVVLVPQKKRRKKKAKSQKFIDTSKGRWDYISKVEGKFRSELDDLVSRARVDFRKELRRL